MVTPGRSNTTRSRRPDQSDPSVRRVDSRVEPGDVSPGKHCAVMYKPFALATLNQQVEQMLKNRGLPP